MALQQSTSSSLWLQSFYRKETQLGTAIESLSGRGQKKLHAAQIPVFSTDALTDMNLTTFNADINTLRQRFGDDKTSRLVGGSITARRLNYLDSLTSILSIVSQHDPVASLIWSVLHTVVKCCYTFRGPVEKVLSQLEPIHDLLSPLRKDGSFYADPSLDNPLKAVFESYVDFCIAAIQLLSKGRLLSRWAILSASEREAVKERGDRLRKDVEELTQALHDVERHRPSVVASTAPTEIPTHTSTPRPQESRHASQTIPTAEIRREYIEKPRLDEFTGRKKELEQLTKWLDDHTKNQPLSISIQGWGGVGKTESALELAYKSFEDKKFDIVIWVPADPGKETETIRTLCNFGSDVGLFEPGSFNDPQVERVKRWLEEQDMRWLIVFDNVVALEHVARFWPNKSKRPSAIVVTTQRVAHYAKYQLDLEPLDSEEGADFLLHQLPSTNLPSDESSREAAKSISEMLGGSPLQLNRAQGLMNLMKFTMQGCLDFLHKQGGSTAKLGAKGITHRYPNPAEATHDKILEVLPEEAKRLLCMLTFMNPDNIPHDLFESVKDEKLAFCRELTRFLVELSDCRLVQPSSQSGIAIHRATQATMRDKLSEDVVSRDQHFHDVVSLLRDNFPEPSDEMELQQAEAHVWPHIIRVLPHLMEVLDYFERTWPQHPGSMGSMVFARLLSDVGGMDLYDRGRIDEAYRMNKLVEKILKELEHGVAEYEVTKLKAQSLAIVGMCSDFMAITKRQEGLKIRNDCVEYRETCHALIEGRDPERKDKIWLHNAYTDLVCSQQQVNDFEGARGNLEYCFNQYREWGSEDEIPYEYAKYYNQMAYILLYENEGKLAVDYAKRGYELQEKATPGAQIVNLYKFDYANILFQHGEQLEALAMLQSLLEQSERECGKENVRTLEVRLNVGIACYFLKKYELAKEHITAALNITDRRNWPEENVVRGKYYLSQTLSQMDPNDPEARDMEMKALESLRQLLEQHDKEDKMSEYKDNLPMQYDYLVHWECRLVTPRKKSTP